MNDLSAIIMFFFGVFLYALSKKIEKDRMK
jgi:hypothetical protein